MGAITVQKKSQAAQIDAVGTRTCFCCGRSDWLKITLVGIGATSFALCPKCAGELADKINDTIGKNDDGK